jgi:hypothetical protein
MSRRVYEVVPVKEFVEPSSFEDAMARKEQLRILIEESQAGLSERDPMTRPKLLEVLRVAQRDMRQIKVWLAQRGGNGRKASEWSLLAKAYHLLEKIGGEAPEVEELLEQIEYMIPPAFLAGDADPGPRAG